MINLKEEHIAEFKLRKRNAISITTERKIMALEIKPDYFLQKSLYCACDILTTTNLKCDRR